MLLSGTFFKEQAERTRQDARLLLRALDGKRLAGRGLAIGHKDALVLPFTQRAEYLYTGS